MQCVKNKKRIKKLFKSSIHNFKLSKLLNVRCEDLKYMLSISLYKGDYKDIGYKSRIDLLK